MNAMADVDSSALCCDPTPATSNRRLHPDEGAGLTALGAVYVGQVVR